MNVVVSLVAFLCMPVGDPPLPLQGLASARGSFETGRIIWATRCSLPRPADDTANYRWHSWDTPRHFTSTLTPNEYMVVDHGDPAGVVYYGSDGRPDPYLGHLAQRALWWRNLLTQSVPTTPARQGVRGPTDLIDARTFGIGGVFGRPTGHRDAPSDQTRATTVDARGDLYEVVKRFQGTDRQVHYWLDPQRDWNPVRVTVVEDGKVAHEARSTLAQFDDIWFPERVEFYHATHADGNEPAYVIEVLSASFNQPDHPRELTPAMIGIDVGTQVAYYERGAVFRPARTVTWDGEKFIALEEFERRLRAGELDYGPQARAAIQYWDALGLEADAWDSEWERLVRAFIARYNLHKEQAERAWKILHDCQDRARQYLSRNEREIETLKDEVRRLCDPAGEAGAEKRGQKLERAQGQMRKLLAPLNDIRYRHLEPRLEKIPTRAQREAAATTTGPRHP